MNTAKQNINIDPVDFAVRISIQCNVGKFTEHNSTKAVDKISEYQLLMKLIRQPNTFVLFRQPFHSSFFKKKNV